MDIIESIKKNKLYAVVRVENKEEAINITQALIDGGIKNIEITLENAFGYDVIEKFASNNKVSIAAGGIVTQSQAEKAINAGAKLIVSPVFQMSLVKFCKSAKIPHISTATTANEAYNSWKARVPITKIYPTLHLGGVEYIQDLLRPMPFLNVLATGGIEIADFTKYLDAGAVAVGIGRAFYKNLTIDEVYNRALFATSELKRYLN